MHALHFTAYIYTVYTGYTGIYGTVSEPACLQNVHAYFIAYIYVCTGTCTAPVHALHCPCCIHDIKLQQVATKSIFPCIHRMSALLFATAAAGCHKLL